MYSAREWGKLPDGRTADLITLTSAAGAVAEISNYGGIIRSLTVPLPGGEARQVVLGYGSPAEYVADTASIGITVGPYANRIRQGRFTLDGTAYELEQNEGENTLHSGSACWGNKLFHYAGEGDAVTLTLSRPDGEGGFPGNLDASVRFAWRDPMTLEITYFAETDAPTVVSMTHHSYFNLGPEAAILTHRLRLRSDAYTPVDDALLPTGEIAPVAGTPFDFREAREIGGHYDHNFVIAPGDGPAATLTASDGALTMDVHTDAPGVQLYTGTYLTDTFPAHGGVCLETQFFPDAPNIPAFPSPVVRPGTPYRSVTAFAFRTGE